MIRSVKMAATRNYLSGAERTVQFASCRKVFSVCGDGKYIDVNCQMERAGKWQEVHGLDGPKGLT